MMQDERFWCVAASARDETLCSSSRLAALLALSLLLGLCACDRKTPGARTVRIDGSSTVYPLTEAVIAASQRGEQRPPYETQLHISGTGGGFAALCAGRADLIGASRPITAAERAQCAKANVAFIELPLALDGIAIVTHPSARWVNTIRVEELRALWSAEAEGKVRTWRQLRADWPEREVHLYGPGPRSGTYDHFTEKILGRGAHIRRDYTSNEDDHVLLTAVAKDPAALGFFSYVYWREHRDRLKLLAVQAEKRAPVLPSPESIQSGAYRPLSRPVFLYVARGSADRAEVSAFVSTYLDVLPGLVTKAGYISLGDAAYGHVVQRWRARRTGSIFPARAGANGALADLLKRAEEG